MQHSICQWRERLARLSTSEFAVVTPFLTKTPCTCSKQGFLRGLCEHA